MASARGLTRQSGLRSIAAAARILPAEQVPLLLKPVLAIEILSEYVWVRRRMRAGDFRDVVRRIRDRSTPSPAGLETGSLDSHLAAQRLGNAVTRTLSILPTDSRCLVQSLVLSRLLAARAISSSLVIGAHSKPDFLAHAWVEHAGYPVLPVQDFYESRLLEL